MNITTSKSKGGEKDFSKFWDNFQPFPFKWANRFINQSRWLVGSVVLVYIMLALMTFVPSLGSNEFKVLWDYPSLSILLIGWIMVFMLVVRWRRKIPFMFQWLWDNARVGQQNADLKKEYGHFLEEYQEELLSKKGSLSINISLIVLLIYLVTAPRMPQFLYEYFTSTANFIFYVILAFVLFWVFLIGSVSWLLIVTSKYIGKLTERFSIQIQPSHPDGSGGLKPLGDFCFAAATPIIVGGLLLAIISTLRLDIDHVLSNSATIGLFLIAGPLTVIAAIVPLWNIHNNMVEHKKAYADQFTEKIMVLEKEIFVNTSKSGDLVKAKAAKEKLEILKTLHPDKLSYPVWPFRFTQTILKLFSPQLIATLIGIATSIYSTFFK